MTDQDKKKHAPKAFDDATFQALEMEFQQTLDELTGDENLAKFQFEYKRMFTALSRTRESEQRLMRKCRELQTEMITNSATLNQCVKISQNDQTTIVSLKKEVQKAWGLLEASHEKETKSRDTIHALRQEITSLSRLVEQSMGLLPGQQTSLDEQLKLKEKLTSERDALRRKVSDLRDQLTTATTKLTTLQQEKACAEDKVSELTKDLADRVTASNKESRQRDKLERELRQAQADLDNSTCQISSLQNLLGPAEARVLELERVLDKERKAHELLAKDADTLKTRYDKLAAHLEEQLNLNDAVAFENQAKAADLKRKSEAVQKLETESEKLSKTNENTQRRLRQLEDSKMEVEAENQTLRSQTTALQKELEAAEKQAAMDKNAINDLTRQRNILKQGVKKAKGATQKQVDLLKQHEQSAGSLQQEIAGYRQEASKQRTIICQLEVERDRYINEASSITQQLLGTMEDLKAQGVKLLELRKKLAVADTKLKQLQNLYEAVRGDRNLYSKNLIESQDEITECKRKMALMARHVTQLKEEVQNREDALVQEQLQSQQAEKEKAAMQEKVDKMKKRVAESQQYMNDQEAEISKLTAVVNQAEALRKQERKEIDKVITERDILGSQLVLRNDELSLLYEKLRLQDSMLTRGEKSFQQRAQDLRILKLEVKNLRRQNIALRKNGAKLEPLKKELLSTERQLRRVQARCMALEEEVVHPANIHRWRTLQGRDPPTYELLLKAQTLQKRLILKTEEVVEKELVIKEKETLYLQLRAILARQPGPETAEQLLVYQTSLKDKTRQLKALTSELNMSEIEVSHQKHELQMVEREMRAMKTKYYCMKKQEQKARKGQECANQTIGPQNTSQPRVSGAGFRWGAQQESARTARTAHLAAEPRCS